MEIEKEKNRISIADIQHSDNEVTMETCRLLLLCPFSKDKTPITSCSIRQDYCRLRCADMKSTAHYKAAFVALAFLVIHRDITRPSLAVAFGAH